MDTPSIIFYEHSLDDSQVQSLAKSVLNLGNECRAWAEENARLKAKVERLDKALAFSNSLAKGLYEMVDLRMSKKDLIGIGFTKKQADAEWEAYQAAKEGKQS